MNKKIVSTLAVGLALAVPALVVAQQAGLAPFADNEPLTATRLNQVVSAVNAIDFATPLFIEAVGGNVTGGPTTRNFTAQSPGIFLMVPGGTGFQGVSATVTGAPNGGPDVIMRSLDGQAFTLPIGTGQTITLSFTNLVNQTPNVNVYFTALTGGAPPIAN
jgi:hypothetical protein